MANVKDTENGTKGHTSFVPMSMAGMQNLVEACLLFPVLMFLPSKTDRQTACQLARATASQ